MFEVLFEKVKNQRNKVFVLFVVLVILDVFVFWQIKRLSAAEDDLKIYFLDVGQGDSALVILPGGAKVLIDGGPPNGKFLENLSKILPPTERYIDLVMLSHAQLDHFGGLIEVLKRYRVGAFLDNGRPGEIKVYSDLAGAIKENSIQHIVLGAEDKIHYQNSHINILSPDVEFLKSKELNDTAIVAELLSNNAKILFTGDIGFDVEQALVKNYSLSADILKVAHHGSKYSSSASFLDAVRPKIAAIGVGKNSYGHPTKETLSRLASIGGKIYRTDKDGTIEILIGGGRARIFKKEKILYNQ